VRLAFADYLDEVGDPRGPGMRALAALGWSPYQPEGNPPEEYSTVGTYLVRDGIDRSQLPDDWFDAAVSACSPPPYVHETEVGRWVSFEGDALTWDAVLRGFALLPPRRQAELLNPAAREAA
jgi:hypothetical protein